MVEALLKETVISLSAAREHIPGRPSRSSIQRFISRSTGRLETFWAGGRRYTTIEACHRFCEDSTASHSTA
jgi:Protein of unknown function (DUF1580)